MSSASDWTEYDINVGYYTDAWGAYVFPFTNKLPSGDTLDAVTVNAFVGADIDRTADLTALTDITADLIEATPVISADGLSVAVKFQYPGDTYKGDTVSLVFEITTAGGGKHTFYHHHVMVQ